MPCQTVNELAGCAKPGLLSALASPQPFDGTVPDMETRGRAGVLSTIDGSAGDTKNGSLKPKPWLQYYRHIFVMQSSMPSKIRQKPPDSGRNRNRNPQPWRKAPVKLFFLGVFCHLRKSRETMSSDGKICRPCVERACSAVVVF